MILQWKMKPIRRGVDKDIVITGGKSCTILIDYDDVDHEEAERVAFIIMEALKSNMQAMDNMLGALKEEGKE